MYFSSGQGVSVRHRGQGTGGGDAGDEGAKASARASRWQGGGF